MGTQRLVILSTNSSALCFLILLGLCGCTVQNKVMPLRGEDPECLELSGERKTFLEKTGASRTLEIFIEALKKGDYEKAYSLLGANTKALLKKEASERGLDVIGVIKRGVVLQVSVAGSAIPLSDLKTLREFHVIDEGQGDYKRTNTRLVLKSPPKDPIVIPAYFEAGAWYLELSEPLAFPSRDTDK